MRDSAFLFMRRRVAVDGGVDGYTPRQIFSLALQSTKANHFAKKVFDLCLSDGAASRLPLRAIERLAPMFDDFESMLFGDFSDIVTAHPESFGITQHVAYRFQLSENEYVDRRRTGVLLTNELPGNELNNIVRLDRMMVRNRLREFALVSTLDVDDRVTLLPHPLTYDEKLVDRFMSYDPPPFTIESVDSKTIHLTSIETITTGKFVKQFIIPSVQPAFRPDQIYWGARTMSFWAAGWIFDFRI